MAYIQKYNNVKDEAKEKANKKSEEGTDKPVNTADI
jgi:hypothetical protein